jgi:hypothetical protein
MTRPDFVAATLDILDSNWNTTNADPQPILVDDRDRERQDTGERAATIDLTENAVISVNGPVTVEDTPLGTEYDVDFREGVSVHLEGVHYHERGTVGDGATDAGTAWSDLTAELKRALYADRIRPTSDPRVRHLVIADESDNSTAGRDLFQLDLTVAFIGRESLP